MTIATSIAAAVARPIGSNLSIPGLTGSLPSSGLVQQSLAGSTPGLDGQINGAETGKGTQRAMQPGKYYDFDGTDDEIILPTISTSGAISFSIWVKSSKTTNQILFGDDHTSNIYTNVSGVNWTFWINGTNYVKALPENFGNGNWRFCTITVAADGTLKFYMDGILIDTQSAGVPSGNIDLVLGNSNSADAFFDGLVHDFRWFDSELTLSEIRELATLGTDALPNKATVLHYKCEDTHPTLALDSSGNKNNGTKTSIVTETFHATGSDAPHSFENDKGYSSRVNFIEDSENVIGSSFWARIASGWEELAGETLPLGVSKGYKVTPDTGTQASYLRWVRYANTSTEVQTLSCYIKRDGYRWAFIGDGAYGRVSAKFDFDTVSATGMGTSTDTATMEAVGDDWFLVTLTGTFNDAANSGISFQPDSEEPTSIYGQTGPFDGTGSLKLCGFQLNDGTTRTEYQPTSGGSAATGFNIPRDESDKTKDIFGGTLQYSGKCPVNAQLIESNCATFDGVDDNAGTGARLTSGALSQLFCSFWMNTTDTNSSIVGEYETTGNERGWLVTIDNAIAAGKITVRLSDDGTNEKIVYGSTTVNDGEWHRIAIHYDADTVALYVDGVEETLTTDTARTVSTINDSTAEFLVGSVEYYVFSGSLAAMTVAVGSDAATNLTAYLASYNDFEPSGLLFWPMAEEAGDVHYDASGNGNDGTITNHTESTYFGTKQNKFHYNYVKGRSKRQNKCPQTTSTGWTANATTLTTVDGPYGTNNALRVVNADTTNAQHRTYLACPDTDDGDYLIFYLKQVGTAQRYMSMKFTGGDAFIYDFDDEDWSSISSGSYAVSSRDVGNGWKRLAVYANSVSTGTVQFAAQTNNAGADKTFTPANTTDGFDVFLGIVDDPETDPFPTTGSSVSATSIPSLSDGSGDAVVAGHIQYPAGAYHNGCESKIDFTGGIAFPQKDYSVRDNVIPSIDLSSGWSLGNVTAPRSPTKTPKGDYTGFRLTENSSTATHEAIEAISGLADQVTISVQVKDVDRQYFTMGLQASGVRALVNFDLTSGTSVDTIETNSTLDDYAITPVADGWYLCEVTATVSGGFSQVVFALSDSETFSGSGAESYTGDGSSSVDLDAIKLEEWHEATAYIPATRPTLVEDWEFPVELVEGRKDLDNTSFWGTASLTSVTGGQSDPDGGTEAFTLLGNGGSSPRIQSANSMAVLGSKDYELTVSIKEGTSASPRIAVYNNAVSVVAASITFSWSGGVLVAGNQSGTIKGVEITDQGSGWYQVRVAFTNSAETTAKALLYADNGSDTDSTLFYNPSLARIYENPHYYRQVTKNGVLHRCDRFLNYSQVLVGQRNTAAETYTATTTV